MTIEITIFLIALMLTITLATFVGIFSSHIKDLKKKIKILEHNHLSFRNEVLEKIIKERNERIRMVSKTAKVARSGRYTSNRTTFDSASRNSPSKGKLHITRGRDTAVVDVKFYPDS